MSESDVRAGRKTSTVKQRLVGEAGLGDYARQQIERARRDPRLERNESAAIADFWDAVEEPERVRMPRNSGSLG